MMLSNIIRAFRLPFTATSILPYIYGALLAENHFRPVLFCCGLIAVICTHISANLINDYADADTGVDALDTTYYGFFGGSKLIQNHIFSPQFFLSTATALLGLAFAAVLFAAYLIGQPLTVILFFFICFLGWSYSCRPLALSYRSWGEITVFILFGFATVCGGFFL